MSPTLKQLFAVFVLFISAMDFHSASPLRLSMKTSQIFNQINQARFPTYRKDAVEIKSTIPEQPPTAVLNRENRESDSYAFQLNTKDDMDHLDPKFNTPKTLTDDNKINVKCLTRFEPVTDTNRLPSFYYKAVINMSACGDSTPLELKSKFIFLEKTSEDKRFKLVVEEVITGCVCGLSLGAPDGPQTNPSSPLSQQH